MTGSRTPNHPRLEWWRLLRRYAFHWDLGIGLLVFVGFFALAKTNTSVLDTHLLDVSLGLGIAILAVVIAAISILTAFLTEDYGLLLRATFDDVSEVFYPYRLVALVSCATVLVSGTTLAVWPIAPSILRELLMAFALALTAWATLGGLSLVGTTADHGRMKMRIPEIQEAYDHVKAAEAAKER